MVGFNDFPKVRFTGIIRGILSVMVGIRPESKYICWNKSNPHEKALAIQQ